MAGAQDLSISRLSLWLWVLGYEPEHCDGYVQGYLAHQKMQPPGTLPYAWGPREVPEGWAFSYERGPL